jgi:ABC-type lipoprotein export system ATPase subunit
MTAPLIITRELTKSYELGGLAVQALRGVSLSINAGEFVAVMGPSGSGKSTFMNLLGCLDTPSSGDYLLAGERISGLDNDALAMIRNRRIGFVFQSFNLLPRTSALENISLPLLYCGVPAEERKQRAAARLAEVGLAERGHHHRVAIARALVNDPVLILADEPTGALDTLTSCEVMALLQQLNARGMTVVVVTHERDIADFAHRVVTFRDGRVVEDHPVDQPKDAAALAMQIRAGQKPEEVQV